MCMAELYDDFARSYEVAGTLVTVEHSDIR